MKVYRMRALSDQTYNTFLNEILIENKDCQLERPGKGDGDIGSQETICADDPTATHDGTIGAVEYFFQCIHQLTILKRSLVMLV